MYELEQKMTTDPSIPIPGCEHIAAAFQQAVFCHIITRTERAIIYCQKQWPMLSNLVCQLHYINYDFVYLSDHIKVPQYY